MATHAHDGGLPYTRDPELAEPLARFADNLRRARLCAGLSQEELAWEADMHRTALSRLETCERAPEFKTLLRLSRALEIPLASLLRGVR
jgi:transcriptional regulator with XRE-family HTH domain